MKDRARRGRERWRRLRRRRFPGEARGRWTFGAREDSVRCVTELRAHHLLCMLTYVGRGYSEAFVRTMSEVVARVGAGERFRLVDGPDTLCAALDPSSVDAEHCHAPRNLARDAVAWAHVERALGRALPRVTALSPADLLALRRAFTDGGGMRESCVGCEWHHLCDDVGARGFEHTELLHAQALRRPR